MANYFHQMLTSDAVLRNSTSALVSGKEALILSLRPGLNWSAINSLITSCGPSIHSLHPTDNGKLGKVRIAYLAAINQTRTRK